MHTCIVTRQPELQKALFIFYFVGRPSLNIRRQKRAHTKAEHGRKFWGECTKIWGNTVIYLILIAIK